MLGRSTDGGWQIQVKHNCYITSTRVALPPGLPTGAKGVPKQGGAIPWVQGLPKGGAHLLLYTREEYQDLSRPLGSSAGSKCRHRPICPPGASWGSRHSYALQSAA